MLGQLFNTFANCFKIPELRSRILFSCLVLAVVRLVAMTPIPGLDGAELTRYFEQAAKSAGTGGVLGLYSLFTGGALEKCAVGSLGIMPYISATIIIQLLSAVVPTLGKLAREEGGRAKLIAYGRYLTVLLCLGQGLVMTLGWEHPEKAFQGFSGKLVLIESLWAYRIQTVFILTAGTLLLMWLGEQITERGVGNGVSLIITVGILARFPQAVRELVSLFGTQGKRWPTALLLLVLLIIVVAGVIAITQAQRKIPVQYAQRAVGRKVVQGGSSFMPLRVNYAGVMPVIFAQAILMFPGMIFEKLSNLLPNGFWRNVSVGAYSIFGQPTSWGYILAEALMILFFSYFWVATQFNEVQVADDLKKHNGYIPGVRPGSATSDFLHRTMSRITLAGAIFLMVIAVIPTLMNLWVGVSYTVAQFFGGTSILITVGVLLDTMRQMESYLLMRHYDGFLKKGRVKGRS
jgi:preprotein translocase subunit SecY